jgi:iron(III) transport system ATP-binding protein
MPRSGRDGKAPERRAGRAGATIAARLTLQEVERRYAAAVALAGVSLDVAPAEVVYLRQDHTCAHCRPHRVPTRGRVLINGQEASAPYRFVLPEERNVGLMFQDFGATPWCSIATPSTCLWLGSFPRSTRSRGA